MSSLSPSFHLIFDGLVWFQEAKRRGGHVTLQQQEVKLWLHAQTGSLFVPLRHLHAGEDAITGQRLPPPSAELRRRSCPAEQTQGDAAVHPVHGGHEAAVRQVGDDVTE